MNNFKVSIIVPFYNEELHIGKAITSLLEQTYENIEIVLIDDHSSDGSKKIIDQFSDNRILYFHKGNIEQGRASSRNLGITKSTGEIITFLDADDECDSNRIQKQLDLLLDFKVKNIICGCWVQKRGMVSTLMKMPLSNEEIIKGFNRQYNRTTIVGATIMGERQLFEEFMYQEKLKLFEDWDLILRWYQSGRVKFINVGEPLYFYNIHSLGTKFDPEWFDYNLFARDCQIKRKNSIIEFKDLEEFKKDIFNNPLKITVYFTLKTFLRLKLKIKG